MADERQVDYVGGLLTSVRRGSLHLPQKAAERLAAGLREIAEALAPQFPRFTTGWPTRKVLRVSAALYQLAAGEEDRPAEERELLYAVAEQAERQAEALERTEAAAPRPEVTPAPLRLMEGPDHDH